jgi:hypothetical protein
MVRHSPSCLPRSIWPRTARALILLAAFAGCDSEPVPELKAYQISSHNQLIGGPSATLDVGDFMLENDKIRLGILNAQKADGSRENSFGPGLFGGSIADADLKRLDAQFANGNGLDQFAEDFPTINLKITGTQKVEVVKDGSDGKEAIVRMSGASAPYFSLLELLDVLCVPASTGQFVTEGLTDFQRPPTLPGAAVNALYPLVGIQLQ